MSGEIAIGAGLMNSENGSSGVDNRYVFIYSSRHQKVIVGWPTDDDVWNLVPREPVAGDQEVVLGVRCEQTAISSGVAFDVGRRMNDAVV
jgi:hypothetical protein